MDFDLTTDERSDATVVGVFGELDLATAPRLAEALEEVGEGLLAVDLTGTTFLDSTGVRTIANVARERHGSLVLVCPPSNSAVTRVLDLTGFGDALTVHESLADLDDAATGS